MAHALEPDARHAVAFHHEGGVGFGRIGLPFQGSGDAVVWNDDRTRGLVMEGELYDTASLEQALAKDGAPTAPGPRTQGELLLRLYEQYGEAAMSKLNGAFVAVVWDRASRRLVVFNDRLGLFPLYYARANGGLVFGSGVRALLADSAVTRTVDLVAIHQFLVFDHALGDRTLVEAVRLLPQGSLLTFADGQFAIRRYWRPQYPEVYTPQPEGAYIEQFVHHLRRAVARQQPNGRPAAVLLSGGMDSRLLLGPLVELGAKVETLTFGVPGCDDARVAAEVADTLGTGHHFFELAPDWLLGMADEAVRLTDGLGNIVNLHAMATREQQAQRAQLLFKGFLGDALLGFALKPQMWADYDTERRFDVHLGAHVSQGVVNYDRVQQRHLLSDAFQARVGDALTESYREGMDQSGVRQLAAQRLYFDLTQRVPRMTLNGVEVARSRAVVRLPFADNDLVDFAVTIPPGHLFERNLPKAALVQHFPRLARIPLASTGRPLVSCARDLAAQARTLASWHLRKYGLGRLAARERRPYKDYDAWLRTALRPWVESTLLDRRTLDRGYFRPEFVRQLVSEHMAGINHAVRLGALLSVELWHRQFAD